MPDLSFKVEKAGPVPYSASPLMNFTLRVDDGEPVDEGATPQTVHAVVLRCQIRIEPGRRHYAPAEQERLVDLFGEPSRWGQTLRPMLWTHTSVVIPPFSGSTTVELPVPCTYDFNLAATKFFHALENDEVPLCLLFSGTIFYASQADGMQITQIPWTKEATFKLPVQVWKQMMDLYYPNTVFLGLRKDAFDRLARYKSSHGLPTWEGTIEKLLAESDEQVTT